MNKRYIKHQKAKVIIITAYLKVGRFFSSEGKSCMRTVLVRIRIN